MTIPILWGVLPRVPARCPRWRRQDELRWTHEPTSILHPHASQGRLFSFCRRGQKDAAPCFLFSVFGVRLAADVRPSKSRSSLNVTPARWFAPFIPDAGRRVGGVAPYFILSIFFCPPPTPPPLLSAATSTR